MDVNGIGLSALSGYMKGYGQKSAGDISQRIAAHIAELDADEDGGLNSSETAASEEVFDAMDTNEDGVVS